MQWWFFFSLKKKQRISSSLTCGPAERRSLALVWRLPRLWLSCVICTFIYTFLFLSPLTRETHGEMDETFPELTGSLRSSCSLRPKCGFPNWCNQLLNSATAVAVAALAAESRQEKQNPATLEKLQDPSVTFLIKHNLHHRISAVFAMLFIFLSEKIELLSLNV